MAVARVKCDLCDWWVASIVTDAEDRLRKHMRLQHPGFPPESKLFVLPPVPPPCGVMVANDPRARCTKESDHEGKCDHVPDRHALAPEEPDDAETRAYLNALRMVVRALESFEGRTLIVEDIERVVALYGRTLELGGATEGHS